MPFRAGAEVLGFLRRARNRDAASYPGPVTEILLDVVGVLVLLFAVALLVGLVSGRVKARSCCTLPADRDLRLHATGQEPPAD